MEGFYSGEMMEGWHALGWLWVLIPSLMWVVLLGLLAWGATRMIFIRRGTGRELSAIVLVLRTSCVLRTSWS